VTQSFNHDQQSRARWSGWASTSRADRRQSVGMP
jgi:hypothetical protein